MIRDPLSHIVRNSIDHGIEPADVRRAAGKPVVGRLRVSARQSGNQILIEASDDGKGVDDERLVAKAISAGVITAEQAERMPRSRRLDLVFSPGLSTASAVTDISGRGVGMDVVRANIERIGGTVELDSRLGFGLKLTMCVPLTLTIIPALTVSSGGHRFAIPRSAIDELVRVGGDGVRTEMIAGSAIARIREAPLPLIDLAAFLGLDAPVCGNLFVVLRAGGGERFVLAVDAVHDHEELVVKPAAPELMATGIYAGTTLPDNSRPMLLLDVAGIAAQAGIVAPERGEEPEAPAEIAATAPTLLFRDLDKVVRAVRLALTDRIEDVPCGDIFTSNGALRLAHDDRMTLLVAAGPLPETGKVRLLQLNDGSARLAYAIAEVLDIVALPEILPSADIAAGATLIDGRPVELLDVHSLFAAAAVGMADRTQPMCLIADADDMWARQVLAPLLGAAGYRVSFTGEDEADAADVVIAAAGTRVPEHNAPVVRLRSEPQARNKSDDSVYRYDRHALLGALSRQVGARA
jgi:two-component system chemotaxis sensor kinase CheA